MPNSTVAPSELIRPLSAEAQAVEEAASVAADLVAAVVEVASVEEVAEVMVVVEGMEEVGVEDMVINPISRVQVVELT